MQLRRALELGETGVVSFVGAGGKKTAMATLVREASDRAVAYTTTTNMPPPEGIPLVLISPDELLRKRHKRRGAIALGSTSIDAPKRVSTKVRGFEPEAIDRIAERDLFDWILVKADGARRRELTAPSANEPVIPRSSSLVVVVASIDVIGRRIDSDAVHRPEVICELGGARPDDSVSIDILATVLAHDRGGLKNVPHDARVVLLVNKADTPERRRTAEEVVRAVRDRSDRFDDFLIASLLGGEIRRGPTD